MGAGRGSRNTKAKAMEERTGVLSSSAGLNFHSGRARIAAEVREGILRTGMVLATFPVSSTMTRSTTVPKATLLIGYCGKVAAKTSIGWGGTVSSRELAFGERGGSGTFAAGMAAGLKVTATVVRDRTGVPSSDAGLNCQFFTESVAASVSEPISRMGSTLSTLPFSLTVTSNTTVPTAMLCGG